MSRLIVKNLPKIITEEKLRSVFGEKGHITDIQLKYTKDGVFRRFGFIGYESEEQAQKALKHFNNSYIQTNRINVEVCEPLGAQTKPRSWSKYSADSTAYKKIHGIKEDEETEKKSATEKPKKKKDLVADIIGEHKDDPEFIEFMQTHTSNRTIWGNDVDLIEKNDDGVRTNDLEKEESEKSDNELVERKQNDHEENSEIGGGDEKLAEKNISDLDYMRSLMGESNKIDSKSSSKVQEKSKFDELFTIKIHEIPYKTKRQDILQFFKPVKPLSIRLPTRIHGFCYVGFKNEKDFKRAMLKNKSFMKGKQVFLSDFTEKNKIGINANGLHDSENSNNTNNNQKWTNQEQSLKDTESIAESGRIYFRNLTYTTTQDDLQTLFDKYGPVSEIDLPIDRSTCQIKGFGTVTYMMPEHAVQAFNELDGTMFRGRLLHLIPGKSRNDNDDDANYENLGFKEKKALMLKKSAALSHNWNTLFLGTNAVAEVLAKKLSTTKENILDTEQGGSSAAVRLALGETYIVFEMKKFLEENGVQLTAFDGVPIKRSKTTILAKNLPAETSVSELTPLFAKFGLLGRIIMPPSSVTAIIEFLDPSEARKAFKNLAYSKFKNLPLYLEWAPENTFKSAVNPTDIPKEQKQLDNKSKDDNKIENTEEEIKQESDVVKENGEDIENEDANEPPESGTTLFLRNLNFKTREGAIREHFKNLGTIHTVQVAMKKDPDNPRNKVSLGYGFIQFKTKAVMEKALKEMQFTQIEGNQVELKRSDRVLKSDSNNKRHSLKEAKQTGTKILVRNIPFQAKSNEVREIFKAFGELKSVRLPKKLAPGEETHRGFGFVDFNTKADAKKAFDTLCLSTHLYGRRLVLEWASTTEENVEEIRKRTTKNFQDSNGAAKRSRKSVFDMDQVQTVDREADEDIQDF